MDKNLFTSPILSFPINLSPHSHDNIYLFQWLYFVIDKKDTLSIFSFESPFTFKIISPMKAIIYLRRFIMANQNLISSPHLIHMYQASILVNILF